MRLGCKTFSTNEGLPKLAYTMTLIMGEGHDWIAGLI